MRTTTKTFRKWATSFVVITVALVSPATPVHATAEAFTQQISNTETVAISSPCFGNASATLTYDGVLHVTAQPNGFNVIVNVRGDAVIIPNGSDEPSYSGRFEESQLLNINPQNTVTTLVVTQLDHGMAFHITFHLIMNPDGFQLTVFNVACGN